MAAQTLVVLMSILMATFSQHFSSPGAISKIVPGSSKTVYGNLEIYPGNDGVFIKGVISGLTPGLHGFHIHEVGDLGKACNNAGGHFNPFEMNHGDLQDYQNHVGDLGNIKADNEGVAYINIFDHKGSLDPHSKAFIGNRAFVVHADEDDLGRGNNEGSLKTGNSGARVGCGLIQINHAAATSNFHRQEQGFHQDGSFGGFGHQSPIHFNPYGHANPGYF